MIDGSLLHEDISKKKINLFSGPDRQNRQEFTNDF